MGLGGAVDVGGILAGTGNEAEVLHAANGLANSGVAHRAPSSLLSGHAPRSHGLRTGGNGFDDVVISRAAAEIAFQLIADGCFVESVALARNDVDRGHDHARGAKA